VITPTRLTPEDLPTLRTLEAFWRERETTLRPLRLHRLIPGVIARLVCRVMVLYARRMTLASDERVDKAGRVSRL
jgi:hypothetical protein